MSMYDDIDWDEKATKKIAHRISQVLLHMPQGFPKDIGHSPDLDLKKNGMLRSLTNQTVTKEVEEHRYTTTRTRRRQSYSPHYYNTCESAQYQRRHGGLVSRSCSANCSSFSTKHRKPHVDNDSESSHPRTYRTLPNHQCSIWEPTRRKSQNLPEDLRLIKACDDPGSREMSHLTNHDIQLAGVCCTNSCREYSHPRNDHRSEPKEAIRGNTKIGPVLVVKVTRHFDHSGIKIKIDSMQKDETQSWIVISTCGAS